MELTQDVGLLLRPDADQKQLRVALDVDQVLVNAFEAAMQLINETRGEHHTMTELTDYPRKGGTIFGIPYEEWTGFYERAWAERWSVMQRLVDEAAIATLMQHYAVDLVTSRGDDSVAFLKGWLGANYPNLKFNIVVSKKGSDKAELPYDIYIDDAPRLANSISGKGGKMVFMVRWPHNAQLEGIAANVKFVRSGTEACNVLVEAARTQRSQKVEGAPVRMASVH